MRRLTWAEEGFMVAVIMAALVFSPLWLPPALKFICACQEGVVK